MDVTLLAKFIEDHGKLNQDWIDASFNTDDWAPAEPNGWRSVALDGDVLTFTHLPANGRKLSDATVERYRVTAIA